MKWGCTLIYVYRIVGRVKKIRLWIQTKSNNNSHKLTGQALVNQQLSCSERLHDCFCQWCLVGLIRAWLTASFPCQKIMSESWVKRWKCSNYGNYTLKVVLFFLVLGPFQNTICCFHRRHHYIVLMAQCRMQLNILQMISTLRVVLQWNVNNNNTPIIILFPFGVSSSKAKNRVFKSV